MIFIFERILYTLYVTLISIAVLFILTKIMGQRQIAQLSFFDYITGITIGSIAAELAVSKTGDGIIEAVGAMTIYALVEMSLAILADKFLFIRNILNGRPLVIYDKGKLNVKNLGKAKLDVNELLSVARGKGYFKLTDLEYVLLEPNGSVSFIPLSAKRPLTPEDMSMSPEQERPPHIVILNGKIIDENLKQAGKDRKWLDRKMIEQKAPPVNKIVLALCDDKGNLTVFPDE